MHMCRMLTLLTRKRKRNYNHIIHEELSIITLPHRIIFPNVFFLKPDKDSSLALEEICQRIRLCPDFMQCRSNKD